MSEVHKVNKITKNLSVLPKEQILASQKVSGNSDSLGVAKSHSMAPAKTVPKKKVSSKKGNTFVTENEDRDDESIIDQEDIIRETDEEETDNEIINLTLDDDPEKVMQGMSKIAFHRILQQL